MTSSGGSRCSPLTPEVVKDVVYTMRFDQGSALYGEFGRFYVGYVAPTRRGARRGPPLTLRHGIRE